MSNQPCDQARHAIEQRDFIGWHGLPGNCSPGEILAESSPSLQDLPKRYLGEDYRPVNFLLLSITGYYRPMASFDGELLVLIDGALPELHGGLGALMADLGEPEARLDWYYGTLEIKLGEWVFPGRGISLFLNKAADKALHIALYHSTTLDAYKRERRPHLRKTLNPSASKR